jgi:predicted kinase
MLVAFSGLPGTGKSTLARALAMDLRATYLRIDTIEQSLRSAGVLRSDVGPAGYLIAYALAETNLRLGRIVVADAVNPIRDARDSWRDIAEATAVLFCEVEIVCTDPGEHRRRIETRSSDIPGLLMPTWQEVVDCAYEPWDRPRLILDTAGRSVAASLDALKSRIPPAR